MPEKETQQIDYITPSAAGSLAGLFKERIHRSPEHCAYWFHLVEENRWERINWLQMEQVAARWQEGLRREGYHPGDRIALMLRNSLEWVAMDLAAAGLGLVTVPLFVNDRPENFAHILKETGARLLLIEGVEQWQRVLAVSDHLPSIERIVSLETVCEVDCDPRLRPLSQWLPTTYPPFGAGNFDGQELATIVFTSGTTGKPKGVMLSHRNILENAYAGISQVPVYTNDLFLSFLPLSHTFERTAGYYIPMMAGACVAHARSVELLAEDLLTVRPTVLVSVPRIFERVHKRISVKLQEEPRYAATLFYLAVGTGWKRFLWRQGRGHWTPQLLLWPLFKLLVANKVMARLGGRLRLSISGGAPISTTIAKVFIGLGVNLLQGYGMTEASPVVAVNTTARNIPTTVGPPLPGVEVRFGDDGELLVRGANVMLGYWHNEEATRSAITSDGWLHTGDRALLDSYGHIQITGRLKEIIVLANGEKVPPEDLELAIAVNPLFDQVMVLGEGRPFLTALAVLNPKEWQRMAERLKLDPNSESSLTDLRVQKEALARIGRRLDTFPGYAQIRSVHLTLTPWEINDGLITATLKLRRKQMIERFQGEIEGLYAGH
jgi:long-chain acyl-CoA synthetase